MYLYACQLFQTPPGRRTQCQHNEENNIHFLNLMVKLVMVLKCTVMWLALCLCCLPQSIIDYLLMTGLMSESLVTAITMNRQMLCLKRKPAYVK